MRELLMIGAGLGIVSARVAHGVEDHLVCQVSFVRPEDRIFAAEAVDRSLDRGSDLHRA